jgi:CheY-like chemotaxis protein/DNA-binding CsgD family transcriptional regulator
MLDTQAHARIVLIVDDLPDNLLLLHDALESDGYTVRVATSGGMALDSARESPPDLILLDALMPGLDGFETCRRLKNDFATRDIPVVFMTGLGETDDIVRGFRSGGVDYLTKPVREAELLVRIAAHLGSRRRVDEAQSASDAAGDAILSVSDDLRPQWATPLAKRWLEPALEADGRLPAPLRHWLGLPEARTGDSLSLSTGGQRLVFSRLRGDGIGATTLLLVRRNAPVPQPEVLSRTLRLTAREGEVLYWVALGKTTPDIAEILDSSPRTINKHLEHIYMKLGVGTRTAAATLALNKTRMLV